MLTLFPVRSLMAFSLVFMVGCMSTDPYTGEQKNSNTASGAAIGAAAGAVLGAVTSSKKDRKKGILTGAAAGGAIGGGIGYYMDKQEAELRAKLQGTGVQVQREGDNLKLIMPGNITFAVNNYNIRGDFYQVLESVAIVLKEFKDTNIEVSGFTDSTGSLQYNQTLSQQRANSVAQYLQSQQIPGSRIQTRGYGPSYPIASNDNAAGREQNRRVELQLRPIQH